MHFNSKMNININVKNSFSRAGFGKIVNVCYINYANLEGHHQSSFLKTYVLHTTF